MKSYFFVSRLLKSLTLLSLMISLGASANPAKAVDWIVPVGSSRLLPSINQADSLKFSIAPDRSYCVETMVRNNTSGFLRFNGTVFDNDAGITTTVTPRGESHPRPNIGQAFTDDQFTRLCFVVTGSTTSQESRCSISIDTTTGMAVPLGILRVYETTLSGGFNTSVTNFNFLELTNTMSANTDDTGIITGTVIARNAITDQVVLTQSFTVNPGDRVDINIHDAVGAGAFGPVTVTHDGIPGGLRGVVSQYRLVSVSPFDFEPVLQQQLLTPLGTP